TSTIIIAPHDYLIYANNKESIKNSEGLSIIDIWDATIGMNNTSPGQLILYSAPDCQGNMVDIANQSTGNWFAGEASPSYISMERINPNAPATDSANWTSNNLITRNGLYTEGNKINGTPKSENSVSKSETQTPTLLPFDEFDELTFTYLGSPYIIRNTLYVLEGKTLKIEPGVTIK
ncbi:unnamed protein product, partial [marine sediment metagenome]